MKKLIMYSIFIFLSVPYFIGNNVSVCSNINKINMQEKTKNEIALKDELYNVINNLNKTYLETNKEIFYTKWDGYEWFITRDGERDYESIEEKTRLNYIEKGFNSNEFKNFLTFNYYNRLLAFKKSLKDPVNIGYLMTEHEIGKTLLYILSDRDDLNCFNEDINQDPSRYMSEQDYINYHKARIHIINENKAVYKNLDAEVSLAKNFDVIYFLFVKENDKWLLDGIEICPKDKEEEFDIKLIGEPRPIKYYEAEEYDFPE